MLKALELENFKAFGERTRIEFAPITLIFGENSAGKSSILQALNLLKQTRESRESSALLLPRTEGGFAELGSFQELLFDHDVERPLSIRLDLESRTPRFFPGRLMRQLDLDEPYDFGFEASFNRRSDDNEVRLRQLLLFLENRASPAFSFVPTELTREEGLEFRNYPPFWRTRRPLRGAEIRAAKCETVIDDLQLWTHVYRGFAEESNRVVDCLEHLRQEVFGKKDSAQPSLFEDENKLRRAFNEATEFYSSEFSREDFVGRLREAERDTLIALDGFVPIVVRFDRSLRFPEFAAIRQFYPRRQFRDVLGIDASMLMVEAGRLLEDMLELLFPMGPFRRPPERWYIFTGTSPTDVGYRGDLLPDLLFRRPELVRQTNDWLDRLQIGYHINIRPVGTRSNDLFEVRLIDTRRSKQVEVALSDVGYGISQILPFIVQSLAARGQIITIEQPEVHVHPRLQADLGDLLAEAIREPRGHRFIIETHSEHLVLRVQRLVRTGKLTPDEVSIIYVSRSGSGSTAQRLHLDAEGDFIDEWPGGFFPERLRELR